MANNSDPRKGMQQNLRLNEYFSVLLVISNTTKSHTLEYIKVNFRL